VEAHAGEGEPVLVDRSGGHYSRSMGQGRVVHRDGPCGGDGGSRRWPVVAVGDEVPAEEKEALCGIHVGSTVTTLAWQRLCEDGDTVVDLVRPGRQRWQNGGLPRRPG
jgi:hypothetical protein